MALSISSWWVDFFGTGMNFRPKPRTVAAAAGIDFFIVRLWNCLFMKWVKYTPKGVLPSAYHAFRWVEMVRRFGMNPKFSLIYLIAWWSTCASLWVTWPSSHQMKLFIFVASSCLWHTRNHCCLHLDCLQISWGKISWGQISWRRQGCPCCSEYSEGISLSCPLWLFCLSFALDSFELIFKGLDLALYCWGDLCCCFLD